MSLLSDSKNVYDALNNELPQDDKKAAVETPIIEELLERMRGRSRWIPHNANPSDALTKIIGAHVQPLMDLLKSGFYHLKTEEAELKERAAAKEKTGYAPRLKQSGRTDTNMFCLVRETPRNGCKTYFLWHNFGMIKRFDPPPDTGARCSDSVCLLNSSIAHGGTGILNEYVDVLPQTFSCSSAGDTGTLARIEDCSDTVDSDRTQRSSIMADWAVAPDVRLVWEASGCDGEDLYGCLGVDRGALPVDLKVSYRNGLRAHHPDKGGNERDGSMISVAYRILSDPDLRAMYDKHLLVAYKPHREKPIPAGFRAAFRAVQDLEGEMAEERHKADVKEQRKCEARHMRIVEEASKARLRAEKEDQRAFERQCRLMDDTESCRKRMRELQQFQKENAQRRKDEAEQAALLKARDLEDKRRKQEQRKRLQEAKEERTRKLQEEAEAGRQEAMQFVQEENAKFAAELKRKEEEVRQRREEKAQSAMPSAVDDADEHADTPGLISIEEQTITSLWPTSWQHMFELFHNPHVYEPDPRPQEAFARFNLGTWIRQVWSTNERQLGMTQVNSIASTIAQCKIGEVAQIRWDVDEDTHLPIPEEWGERFSDSNPFVYFHGTNPLLALSFRRWGLIGTLGTKSEELGPCVYACKQRHTPLYSYASKDNNDGFEIIVDNPAFDNSEQFSRRFKMLVGLCPLMPWPWHSCKPIVRKNGVKQYLFASGTCRIL